MWLTFISLASLDESQGVCRDCEHIIAAALEQKKQAVTTVEFLSVDNPEINHLILFLLHDN